MLIVGDEIRREESAYPVFITGVECGSPILDRRADLVLGVWRGLGPAGWIKRRRQRRSSDDRPGS
jgi:hypothetical protein